MAASRPETSRPDNGRPETSRPDHRRHNERRRAFVMVYAVGTLVLVSSLALSLVETTASDIEVSRSRLNLVLARSAAESGIEYAMAFVTRIVGRQADPTSNPIIPGGPWTDVNFDGLRRPLSVWEPLDLQIVHPWFYARRAHDKFVRGFKGGGLITPEGQAEGYAIRLHQIDLLEADVADGAPASQVTQFQISLTPEMTYDNTYIQTKGAGQPTVFTVRSRGEILSNDGTRPTVLASAYLMQTFIVPAEDTGCPNQPKPSRQVLDREPATLIGPPATVKGSATVPFEGPLFPPHPH